MGNIILFALIFLVVCVATVFIGGLVYLLYLPFKKRLINSGKLSQTRSRQINWIYCVLLVLIAFYQTYFSFFPSTDFYRDEFKINTGMNLPVSADILDMDSVYPDQHGDYWSTAIIKLNEADYRKLKLDISRLKDFQIDTSSQKIGITIEYRNIAKDIKENDLETVFFNTKKEWFKLGFHKDQRTIIFERSSS